MNIFFKMLLGVLLVITEIMMPATVNAEENPLTILLKDLPTKNITRERETLDAITALGSNAIATLCANLQNAEKKGKSRLALHALALYLGNDTVENRKMFCSTVCASLKKRADPEIHAFLLRQLQFVAGNESVNAIASFSGNARLCDTACRVLTTIGTEKAVAIMITSLEKSRVANPIPTIKNLGEERVIRASNAIIGYTKSENRDISETAKRALADIGYKPMVRPLASAFLNADGYRKITAGRDYLLIIRRLAGDGNNAMAYKMCRSMLTNTNTPSNMRCCALTILADSFGSKVNGTLLQMSADHDSRLQAVAVQLAGEIADDKSIQLWSHILEGADTVLKTRVLRMFAATGEEKLLTTVLTACSDRERSVRLAAVDTAITLGGDKAIKPVLDLLAKHQDALEAKETVAILMRLPGDKVLQNAATCLNTSSTAGKIALINGLAARHAGKYFSTLVAMTNNEEKSVRIAALRMLGGVSNQENLPDLLKLMLASQDRTEKRLIQKTVVATAKKISPVRRRTELIIPLLSSPQNTENKIALIATLGYLGGRDAVKAVVSETHSQNIDVKDASIRALARWPDDSAIEPLLRIAATESLKYNVLALRQFSELVKKSRQDDEKRAEFCRRAIDHALRDEEKKTILAALTSIKIGATVELAMEFAETEALRANVANTVALLITKGLKDDTLTTKRQIEYLKKVTSFIEDKKLKKKTLKYLDKKSKH